MILRILAVALVGAILFAVDSYLGWYFVGGFIWYFVLSEFDKKGHWS